MLTSNPYTHKCRFCTATFTNKYEFLSLMFRQEHHFSAHGQQLEDEGYRTRMVNPNENTTPILPSTSLTEWAEGKLDKEIGKIRYTRIIDYKIVDEKRGLVEFIFDRTLTGRLDSRLVRRSHKGGMKFV